MKKNKGFTLVEVLVVIVIIGVIAGISIPLIRNLSTKFEKQKYKSYADSMLSAAKLYNDSYSEDLFGHNENGCAYVTYEQLAERNLIKDIDLDKTSCDSSSTFVRVLKVGDKYSYVSFLGCGTKKDGKADKVSYTLPIEGKTSNEMNPGFCTGVDENNLLISANPDKSPTYNKKQAKTKLKIQSGTGINTSIEIYTKWITKAEKDANKYDSITGLSKTGFKVKGDQQNKISQGEIISTTSGELVTPAGVTGEYYLLVRVNKLDDLYGSPWKHPDKTDNKYLTFGPFMVDNEPPTIPVVTGYQKKNSNEVTNANGLSTINSDTWSKNWNLTIPKSTDNSKEKITYYYTITGTTPNAKDKVGDYKNINTEGISKIKYKACDLAGNCSKYSNEFIVKLDRTAPTCGTATGSSTKWVNTNRTIKQACNDKYSGCEKNSYDKTYTNTAKTDTVTIKDKVGNTRNCTYNVYVDKTKPTKPTITNPSNNTWKNSNFSLTLASTDSHSGINYYQYTYNSNDTGWTTYANSNKTTYTTTPFSAERNQAVYIRSCDVAGNCSDKNSTYIRIDKTAPTCTSSGGNTSWTNKDVTLTGTCTDKGGSGCGNITKKYTSDTNSDKESPGTVKDGAGNAANCPADQTVRIDKTAPTCTSSGGNTSWTNKDVTLIGICKDKGGSGCSNITKKYTSETNSDKESPGTVKDGAGNAANCPANQTVRIDKTAPECTPITKNGSASGSNYNGSKTCDVIYTSAKCTDKGNSGCGKMTVTTKGKTTNITDQEKNYWTVEAGGGKSYVTWKVYDKAGNSKTCATQTIDKGINSSDSSCGCQTYNSCSHSDCGTTTTTERVERYIWVLQGNCQERITAEGYSGYWYAYNPGMHNAHGSCTYAIGRKTNQGCCLYYQDREVEINKTCRTAACGCEQYKSCCH